MTSKINTENVIAYFIGNLRYKLYYSRFKFLIRTHIREQIDFRIKVMAKECYENGQCVICGCSTTALQMANKACDKPCYPPMMSKKQWRDFNDRIAIAFGDDVWWLYDYMYFVPYSKMCLIRDKVIVYSVQLIK